MEEKIDIESAHIISAAQDHPKVGRGLCYHTTIDGFTAKDDSCLTIQDDILKEDDVSVLNHTIKLGNSFLVLHETENSTKATKCQIAEAVAVANMIFDWLCVPSGTRNEHVNTRHGLLLFGCNAGILTSFCYDPVNLVDVLCSADRDLNSTTPCMLVHVADKVNTTCTRNFQLHADVCSGPGSKQEDG